jgi:hypothetical protein
LFKRIFEASAQTAAVGTRRVRQPASVYRANVLRLVGDIGRGQSGDGIAFVFGHRERKVASMGIVSTSARLGRAGGHSLAGNLHEGRSRECRKQNDVADLPAEFTAVGRGVAAVVAGGEGNDCCDDVGARRDCAPFAPNDQNPKGSTRTFSGNFRGNICTPPILQSACQMNLPPIFRAMLLASSGPNTAKISTSTKILVDGLPAQVPLGGSIAIRQAKGRFICRSIS